MRILMVMGICVALGACAAAPTGDGSGIVGRGTESRRSPEVERQTISAQEEGTPYTDMMVYPADWVEISRKRQ